MSSGQSRVVFNNLERALSTDFNTLQDLVATDRNEILLALANYPTGTSAPSASADHPSALTGTTPLRADVFDGLEMLVDTPGSIFITPGVLGAWTGVPASVADSGYVICVDPGVSVLGQLTIATNGSSYSRCDVIECQPVDYTYAYMSRDIRNPLTGLFVPTSVPKQKTTRLNYRVRKGTPGSPPEYAAGWLPLGLAVIQPGATTAQIDFYDVRPLVRERGAGYANPGSGIEDAPFISCTGAEVSFWASSFRGHADVSLYGHRLGGVITKSTPINTGSLGLFGIASPGVDVNDTSNMLAITPSIAAGDILVLSAFLPTLSTDVYSILPRCDVFSRFINYGDTRRRPTGTRGILLAHTQSADLPVTNNVLYTRPYSNGIAGCLGNMLGVPIAATGKRTTWVESITRDRRVTFSGPFMEASALTTIGTAVQTAALPIWQIPMLSATANHATVPLTFGIAGPNGGLPPGFKGARLLVAASLTATLGTYNVQVQAFIMRSITPPSDAIAAPDDALWAGMTQQTLALDTSYASTETMHFELDVSFPTNTSSYSPRYLHLFFSTPHAPTPSPLGIPSLGVSVSVLGVSL